MSEAKQKDILFSLVHGIYKNMVLLHDQDRYDNPLCPNPEYHEEVLSQDLEHILCLCYLVRGAWEWVRGKLMGC